jgi:hypothetical protein
MSDGETRAFNDVPLPPVPVIVTVAGVATL